MNLDNVPDIIVSRLPVYLRALERMYDHAIMTTSSQELGEKVGISAAQIRKDLSQFGEFGKQGTGYHIPFLIEHLRRILHVDHPWNVVIVGMGELGHAIARYQGFSVRGFRVAMCFDSDPTKIGRPVFNDLKMSGLSIQDEKNLVEALRGSNIKMAMLCVPASAAQAVTDVLVEAGIKGILNYAPVNLVTPRDIRVQYIDPTVGLQRMAYYIKE
ncbi:MAG: redox-sensing transcriptional repressor Rex [Anaerolineae bacterium CG_4_9_14_3_um_filter_57_17]|nr:redox-sensing transcriptional repressor Rex [bacterium]NCT19652.1 redox-sensing transcriptional repressor Rex [bacterium]OIO85533.1 MAG: redox-sensing transcriptional repressor Rex [Anaerolineae bacterium CG2_30_57_67]PJB65591.1 MAG: redox-sensing transcriptional repressor Rex [Anaerolineae bacterium CG_4_9_14_3_um_filter_57_17]